MTSTQVELTREEKAKFREVLLQHFPSLDTNAPLGGADSVSTLCGLYATLAIPAITISVRDPNAPVLLIVASTNPDDEGEVYLRQVVTKAEDETAIDRARRLAREEVKGRGEIADEDNPLEPGLLEELQLSVTFGDVEII